MSSLPEISSPERQVLRPSRGNSLAFVVLMLLSGLSDFQRDSRPYSNAVVGRPSKNILRIAGREMKFDKLGISVTPTEGWIYLQPIDSGVKNLLVFVNPKQHLTATIAEVRFRSWPPQWSEPESDDTAVQPVDGELANRGSVIDLNESVTDLVQLPRLIRQLDSRTYGRLIVDWYQWVDDGYQMERYGRIDTGRQELLIKTITSGRLERDAVESATDRFCESIRRLR